MQPVALVVAAVLGSIVGSFLNVCIYRIPRGQSVVHPPSRCPGCGQPLRWFDNVPVVSWIALGGRCRQCQARISAKYPIVETATALLAVAIVALTPPGPLLASRLVLGAILIVLFAIDLELQVLPNTITLPGIMVGFLFSLFAPPGPVASLLGIVLGAGILYAIAAAYYLFRKAEGMGMGDVKMLAMIGAFLGWRAVLLTLVMASLAGSVVGLTLMAVGRGTMRYALPFGTFLAAGTVLSMLVGEQMLNWYLELFPEL